MNTKTLIACLLVQLVCFADQSSPNSSNIRVVDPNAPEKFINGIPNGKLLMVNETEIIKASTHAIQNENSHITSDSLKLIDITYSKSNGNFILATFINKNEEPVVKEKTTNSFIMVTTTQKMYSVKLSPNGEETEVSISTSTNSKSISLPKK
ncbi:MAG: hypothetical protein HQK66_15555 [Desulfamplus sp.]|nr:hypothetical protein [Desulfamplus sp.]